MEENNIIKDSSFTEILGHNPVNPKHPLLNTHAYSSISNPFNLTQKVFEAYAQNNTPAACKLF